MSDAEAEREGVPSPDSDGEYSIEVDDSIIEDLESDAEELDISVDEMANSVVAEHRASDILAEAATKIQGNENPGQDVLDSVRDSVSNALTLLDLSQKSESELKPVFEEAENLSEQMVHIEYTRNSDTDTGDVELYIIHEAQRVATNLEKAVTSVFGD